MVLFSRFSRSNFYSTGLNTHRVFSPVNFSGNRPGSMLFGPIISKNKQYNPIDVGIRQLQGCWRCDVGGAHTLSSANWGLQHSSSRSPYIANLLKRSYKTLYNQFRIGRISIFNRYYQNTRGTLSEIVDFRFQTSEIRRTRKTNTSTGPTGLE